jgi:hypothetical protein
MNISPKYNRTLHLPWSEGATNDDKIASSVDYLLNIPIVITEKMDGSNVSLEYDGCFARTHSGPPTHPSFDGLKALHASIKHKIPKYFQLFGEWCYARHSIEYSELPAYFMMFGIRKLDASFGENNYWISWKNVESFAEELGITTVPVLFKGEVSSATKLQNIVESLMKEPSACGGLREGVVVRAAKQFNDNEFSSHVLKCVRKDHVNTSIHWSHNKIIQNKLKLK